MTTENLTKLLNFFHERTPEELMEIKQVLDALIEGKQPSFPITPAACSEMTDESPMPFGKYKGTKLENVPASYLHWLWTNRPIKNCPSLEQYIKNNLLALKQEHPDGIWT